MVVDAKTCASPSLGGEGDTGSKGGGGDGWPAVQWRSLVLLLILILAGCSDPTGARSNLTGEWSVSLRYGVAALGITCTEGGSIRLSHSGSSLTGTFSTVGNCTSAGAVSARVGNGALSGQVVGVEVSLAMVEWCRFDGRVATREEMSGQISCPLEVQGGGQTATGTWEALRLPGDRDPPP